MYISDCVSFFLLALEKIVFGDYFGNDVSNYLIVWIDLIFATKFIGHVEDTDSYASILALK
jgi:hypothetical protein